MARKRGVENIFGLMNSFGFYIQKSDNQLQSNIYIGNFKIDKQLGEKLLGIHCYYNHRLSSGLLGTFDLALREVSSESSDLITIDYDEDYG